MFKEHNNSQYDSYLTVMSRVQVLPKLVDTLVSSVVIHLLSLD